MSPACTLDARTGGARAAKHLGTPDPTIPARDEPVVWSRPACARRSLFARADSRCVGIDLAMER